MDHNSNNYTTVTTNNHIDNQQYTCILQNVTRNHPIACAILIKSSKFRIHTMESRSRAILLVLQEKRRHVTESFTVSSSLFDETPESFLYIANVHLDARYDQDMTRYNQIKSLLHRMEFHWKQNYNRNIQTTKSRHGRTRSSSIPKRSFISDTTTEESLTNFNETTTMTSSDNNQQILLSSFDASASPMMIIAGDFNMVRTNPIYTLLSKGQYKQQSTKKSTTSNKNARDTNPFAIQLPFLPLHDVFSSNYHQKPHEKLSAKNSKTQASVTLTHSVNCINDTVPFVLRRTFAGGSILDYIWINTNERVHAVPWMIDPICSYTATTAATTRTNHQPVHLSAPPLRFRWPSPDQPSDHVPIGIRFFLDAQIAEKM